MSTDRYALTELPQWHPFFTLAASTQLNRRTQQKSYIKMKCCHVIMANTFAPNLTFKYFICKRQKDIGPGRDVVYYCHKIQNIWKFNWILTNWQKWAWANISNHRVFPYSLVCVLRISTLDVTNKEMSNPDLRNL